MKLIIIGSNPSVQSPDKTAFSPATRSGKTIREWFSVIPDAIYVNVSDEPTPGNRAMKTSEVRGNLSGLLAKLEGIDGVVAVGGTASKAVTMLGDKISCPILRLGHPSGRCRRWNSEEERRARCEAVSKFLTSLTQIN